MITMCGHCTMDSAGNHEWGCPCSPKTYPGTQVDDVVAALGLRLASLEAQLSAVTKEREFLSRLYHNRARANELLIAERDTLRAALKQCAEAMDELIPCVPPGYFTQLSKAMDALALPVVQAVLARSLEGK